MTAPFVVSSGGNTFLCGPNYQQRDIRLFFEQNSHQLDLVAHGCGTTFTCASRMSDESHPAPLARLLDIQ